MDKLSFLNGLALGLAGKPLEFASRKEPTAFFYGHVAKEGGTTTKDTIVYNINGVDHVGLVLSLPEYEKEKYPYAWIDAGRLTVDGVGRGYILNAVRKIDYYYDEEGIPYFFHNNDFCRYYIRLNDMIWEDISADITDDTILVGTYRFEYYPPIWCSPNFNLCNEDGSILVEGCEPIPIYE